MTGKVWLVGAGPGDSGLLTLKGAAVLKKADAVVYDRLIGDDILEMAREDAELIDVGKNAGDHPVPQSRINEILTELAREGKDVVRLKGGDSFIFGRGGEELMELKKNGIDFEVVPGISSSVAAAAYAGIPVTHRDFCSSLHIITGHKKKDGKLTLDYEALVRMNGTLVFMMSVASMGEIADGLMAAGMAKDMPCAVIENGTRPYQRKFVSTIENIKEQITINHVISPAAIIVGRVCTLSDDLDWFTKKPLFGKRVLVTRPKATSAKMSDALSELGADVTLLPAIRTHPVEFALPELSPYEWIVFTSAAGVEAFMAKVMETADARLLFGTKLAVIGRGTRDALLTYGLKADLMPDIFSGEELGRALLKTATGRLLLVRPKKAAPGLNEALEKGGAEYDELYVYETLHESGATADAAAFDFITFTSASCVEGFVENAKNYEGALALCIGDMTAAAAKKAGMNAVVSERATIDSMISKAREL